MYSGSIPDAASNSLIFAKLAAASHCGWRKLSRLRGQGMTKRFQRVLLESLPERKPWEKLTDEQLALVAGQLVDADVSDIIDTLEMLTSEKEISADWDGDTQDDIAAAQEQLAVLLRHLAALHLDVIFARMNRVRPLTQHYLQKALS